VTDDLRIDSDDMSCTGGLKHQSKIIVLHHFQVGVEKFYQSSVHHTCTAIEIFPIVRLDNGMNAVQRWHHDIRPDDVPLSNDCVVHSLGLDCSPIFHSPLMDPARWTACRHDPAQKTNKICSKNSK